MAREFNKDLASLVEKDGQHFVVLPSGELFPCVHTTITKCEVGKDARVTMDISVNIVSTVEEAVRLYNKQELEFKVCGDKLMLVSDERKLLKAR